MADASDVGNYLRARGEYLIVWSVRWSPLELPPRTRRIPMLISGRLHPIRTTSAHAENTRVQVSMCATYRNYLRARGEYGRLDAKKRLSAELPPRTRRILFAAYQFHGQKGTTSAHAENTWMLVGWLGLSWNYLRARGEYQVMGSLQAVTGELPPRTRRILFVKLFQSVAIGTTSAHAENTRVRLGLW